MSKQTPINDIDLSKWRDYPEILTDSLWIIDKSDRAEANNASFHGLFIPEIPRQVIQRYTRKWEVVFDPFLGMGTTAIEAMSLNRYCIGADLSADTIHRADIQTTQHCQLLPEGVKGTLWREIGDSCEEGFVDRLVKNGLTSFSKEEIALAILHPPYHNIVKFSEDPRDLSNCASLEVFIVWFGLVVDNVTKHLQKGRFLVLVIGDMYEKGEVVPLGFECMREVLRRNYRLKAIVVKNIAGNRAKRNQENLWRYRHLKNGTFNFGHEYVFVFQRI